MEQLTNLVEAVTRWVDAHWLLILALYPLVIGILRIIVLVIRKKIKPEDGTRLDGFCDFIEGLMIRSDVILAGLDKIRKGNVIEGVTDIITSEAKEPSSDNTPTLRP